MNLFHEDQVAWLALIDEPTLDPDRPIIDPHHHLWRDMMGDRYTIDQFHTDTASGHNIVASVYMECGTEYRTDGPELEMSLGETAFVMAQRDSVAAGGTPLMGMVGHVDLTQGAAIADVLDKHQALAGDFFKGIRHAGASAEEGVELLIPGAAPRDMFSNPQFREGVQLLGKRGLVYETWHYHYQNQDYLALAQACPDTIFVLDHFGTPLGVPPYDASREEIFTQWQEDIRAIAECPNVYAKLGGLAMPDNGYGWHMAERPPNSDEFVAAQKDWYLHAIDCFGPERCLFESNFPVDRLSLGYNVLYNGLKKIAAGFSEVEQSAMFHDNANKLYTLGL